MSKRNKTNRREPKSGVSPYVRHTKLEYRYSALYQAWRSATTPAAKRDASAAHARHFFGRFIPMLEAA